MPITGFAAGFINTLAGSGTLITLPVLILLGLPANVANGTNRVGVLIQGAVAVATFRQRGALHQAGALLLVVPAVLGAVLGARLAVDLDEIVLRRTIGVLMIVLLVIMLVRPERWLASATQRHARPWLEVPLFFAIGVYGGFIQAGVGIFLIAGLVLGAGYDLVRANAVKNVITLAYTVFALLVFVANGQVAWTLGLLLAAGQGIGAWVAARLAVQRGARFVRWFVVAIVVLSAAALFAGLRV